MTKHADHSDPKHADHPDVEEAPPTPPARSVDVAAVVEHLLTAMTSLARAAGSPPDVMQRLDEVRRLLGKE